MIHVTILTIYDHHFWWKHMIFYMLASWKKYFPCLFRQLAFIIRICHPYSKQQGRKNAVFQLPLLDFFFFDNMRETFVASKLCLPHSWLGGGGGSWTNPQRQSRLKKASNAMPTPIAYLLTVIFLNNNQEHLFNYIYRVNFIFWHSKFFHQIWFTSK